MRRDRRVGFAIGFLGGAALAVAAAAPFVMRGANPTEGPPPVRNNIAQQQQEWRLPLPSGRFVPAEFAISDDERHRLLVSVGNARMDAEEYAAAIESFEAALRIRGDARVWSDLGTCYRYVRRPVDAVNAFERALAADPQLWEAAFNRAVVLAEIGRIEEAKSAVAALRGRYPDNEQIAQLEGVLARMKGGQ